jgi:hypothetical protein
MSRALGKRGLMLVRKMSPQISLCRDDKLCTCIKPHFLRARLIYSELSVCNKLKQRDALWYILYFVRVLLLSKITRSFGMTNS